MPLVSYDSSSSDEAGPSSKPRTASPGTEIAVPPTNKRKRGLPKLPSTFDTNNPRDDPTQHQGRTRSRPFVQGEYNAHVYISLPLPHGLRRVIGEITSLAQELCPGHAIHSLISTSTAGIEPASATAALVPSAEQQPRPPISADRKDFPLHVSLTHPLPLRQSQLISFRDDLRTALRRSAGAITGTRGLRLSIAGEVVGFVNGRKTGGEGKGGRAFLAVRVTAGSKELERLLDQAIHPILSKLHLPLYHTNPQFHASFAWTLIDPVSAHPASDSPDFPPSTSGAGPDADVSLDDAELSPSTSEASTGETPFSPEVLAQLSEKFGKAILAAQPQGGWEVDHLELKLGKEVHLLPLR